MKKTKEEKPAETAVTTLTNAEMGKTLITAAMELTRKKLTESCASEIESLMHLREALAEEVAKKQYELDIVTRKLAAIEAGEVTFKKSGSQASIVFNDAELNPEAPLPPLVNFDWGRQQGVTSAICPGCSHPSHVGNCWCGCGMSATLYR